MTRRISGRLIATYGGAILLGLWTLVPIYWIFTVSIEYRVETQKVPPDFVPLMPTMFQYQRVLGFWQTIVGYGGKVYPPSGISGLVVAGLGNSLIVALAVTLLTMLVALPIAYAIGRYQFRYKSGLLFGILAARSYPPFAVLLPFYMMFQLIGLLGTIYGLILVHLTITIPLVVWIMVGLFAALPRFAEREARLDGCTRWQAFYRVMVPMAGSGIAAAGLIAFLTSWNEFAFALVLTGGTPAQTLPPVVAGIIYQAFGEPGELAAAGLLAILPALLLASVFQRRIRQLNIVGAV
jgi:multiple sugar transport system permease protein